MLVTGSGQLSAPVTHAEQHVTSCRSYLMCRFADAIAYFPNFDEPECVVVIWLERDLNPRSTEALRDRLAFRESQ